MQYPNDNHRQDSSRYDFYQTGNYQNPYQNPPNNRYTQPNSYQNPYTTPGNSYYGGQPNDPWQNAYDWYQPSQNPYQQQYTYPVTNPYQMPVARKRAGWKSFFLLSFLIGFGVWAAVNYLPIPGIGAGNGTIVGGGEREGEDYGFTVQPNDPLYDSQYALQRINAEAAWSVTQGNPNLIVAVIDTGVDASHPDLQGKLVSGYDFVNNDSTPEDTVGHGTFVASLIAARAGDNNGIAGIAPNVKIMPLKALGSRGGSSVAIARAIRYAVDNGAKVINLSLGSPSPSSAIRQALDYAVSKNVVVVAASGNDGSRRNPVEYPAAFPNAISVGATTSRDTVASFSTYNRFVDIAAPGVNVVGAKGEGSRMCRTTTEYCTSSGTSFAAPYVAGTAALMLSANPKLTPAQVQSILASTATDIGTAGRDDRSGAGLLNAGRAVAEAVKTK